MRAGSLRLPIWLNAQRAFVLGLCCFFISLSVAYTFKVTKHHAASAILRWQSQLLSLDQGTNIWEEAEYPNPPIMAIILSPLAKLTPLSLALVWFYLKVGMTLAALYWVFHLVEDEDKPFPPWAKGLAVLLSLTPIANDLTHGNVNLFILFLVVASLYSYQRHHEVACGLLLALAIACKVTPALFVPYFLWKRAWRPLVGVALGLVAFLLVVPGLRLGWAENLTYLSSWVAQMVKPFVVNGIVTSEHQNQSLPGLLTRLFTSSPSFSIFVKDAAGRDVPMGTEWHTLVALSPALVGWLVKMCLGLFAVLVMRYCRTPTAGPRSWRLAAEYSMIVLGMLLFSERTWKHHCVTFVLPIAVLCYHLAACESTRLLRSYLSASLFLVVLLMASTSTDLLPERWGKLAQVYGAYVGAYLCLLAALVVILRRPASS